MITVNNQPNPHQATRGKTIVFTLIYFTTVIVSSAVMTYFITGFKAESLGDRIIIFLVFVLLTALMLYVIKKFYKLFHVVGIVLILMYAYATIDFQNLAFLRVEDETLYSQNVNLKPDESINSLSVGEEPSSGKSIEIGFIENDSDDNPNTKKNVIPSDIHNETGQAQLQLQLSLLGDTPKAFYDSGTSLGDTLLTEETLIENSIGYLRLQDDPLNIELVSLSNSLTSSEPNDDSPGFSLSYPIDKKTSLCRVVYLSQNGDINDTQLSSSRNVSANLTLLSSESRPCSHKSNNQVHEWSTTSHSHLNSSCNSIYSRPNLIHIGYDDGYDVLGNKITISSLDEHKTFKKSICKRSCFWNVIVFEKKHLIDSLLDSLSAELK